MGMTNDDLKQLTEAFDRLNKGGVSITEGEETKWSGEKELELDLEGDIEWNLAARGRSMFEVDDNFATLDDALKHVITCVGDNYDICEKDLNLLRGLIYYRLPMNPTAITKVDGYSKKLRKIKAFELTCPQCGNSTRFWQGQKVKFCMFCGQRINM